MFKKDNVWLGLALGLVVPGIAFLLVQLLKRNLIVLAKDDLLYVGCVALNLVLIKFVYKDDYEQTVRGIISASFICAIIFFFYKYNL
jgi:hypothetical protein